MAEIVEIIKKRDLIYKHPNFIWLLALLSSSSACTVYLYSILPQIVDYLYLELDETIHTEVNIYSLYIIIKFFIKILRITYYITIYTTFLYLISFYLRLRHPFVYWLIHCVILTKIKQLFF